MDTGGRARQRSRIGVIAALVVLVALVLWLVLRYVGAGSDVTDFSAQGRAHQDAATALHDLQALVASPAAVAASDAAQLGTIVEQSGRAQTRLTAALETGDAGVLERATDALQTAVTASNSVTQPSPAPIGPSPAAIDAASTLTTTVGTIATHQESAATAARARASDADSARTWALRWLVVLLVIAGIVAIAGATGRFAILGGSVTRDGRRPPPAVRPDPALRPGPAPRLDGAAPSFAPVESPPRLSGSQPAAPERAGATRTRPAVRAKLAATTSGHPGVTLDAAVHAGVVIYAGSMIGPEHRGGKNVAPREDAYSWSPGSDASVIVMAVADGVGSTRNSHAASLLAAETAVDQLRDVSGAQIAAWFDRPEIWTSQAQHLMASVASHLHPELVDERAGLIGLATASSSSGRRPAEPATTLVVALGAISGDGVRVLWASVGDSQVSVLVPGEQQLRWSQDDGDAPGGTRALPRDAAQVTSAPYFLPPGHAFLLTTDGCEKVLSLDASTVPLLREMIASPGDTARLLDLLQRTPPGAGDDRTLVLFAPTGGAR